MAVPLHIDRSADALRHISHIITPLRIQLGGSWVIRSDLDAGKHSLPGIVHDHQSFRGSNTRCPQTTIEPLSSTAPAPGLSVPTAYAGAETLIWTPSQANASCAS